MSDFTDSTAPVRAKEQIETDQLDAFVRNAVPDLSGELELTQFPGGHSNLTYCLRYDDREFVLRLPPHGKTAAAAHDMTREYRMLDKLHGRYAPAPKPIAVCEDTDIFGAKFYVMERIKGVIFRVQQPDGLIMPKEKVRAAHHSFVDTLADMHTLDFREAGLEHMYKGPGYVQRQLGGWEKRWDAAVVDEVPLINELLAWLKKDPIEDSTATVIHNDYKWDNLIYDPETMTKIIGVLDWEMSTIGDPLSDFATTLTTWIESSDGPVFTVSQSFMNSLPGALSRQELMDRYQARTGFDLSNILYYYIFALYKGAVIIQQIYARYRRGQTTDERFAQFNMIVDSMAKRAAATLDAGTI